MSLCIAATSATFLTSASQDWIKLLEWASYRPDDSCPLGALLHTDTEDPPDCAWAFSIRGISSNRRCHFTRTRWLSSMLSVRAEIRIYG
jgi:hypothetical protein